MYLHPAYVHLLSAVAAVFPSPTRSGGNNKVPRGDGGGGGVGVGSDSKNCTQEQIETLFRNIKIPTKFRRFFDPDCDRNKLVFLPNKQGCLGALRNIEDTFRPGHKGDKDYKELSKWIVCSHKPCVGLPVFRRCGSNEPNRQNPRSFRNGCRQCAASCKEVVSGRRRYVRLGMDECPKERRKTTKTSKSPQLPDEATTLSPKGTSGSKATTKVNKLSAKSSTRAVSKSATTVEGTTETPTTVLVTMKSVTTELATTEQPLTTTLKCEPPEMAPIRHTPMLQMCVMKPVHFSGRCSILDNATGKAGPPPLPPWKPKEDR